MIDLPDETVTMRAQRLLREYLPPMVSRDQAVDYLFLVPPTVNVELKLWVIAAAVYVLSHEVKP